MMVSSHELPHTAQTQLSSEKKDALKVAGAHSNPPLAKVRSCIHSRCVPEMALKKIEVFSGF